MRLTPQKKRDGNLWDMKQVFYLFFTHIHLEQRPGLDWSA